MTEIHLKILILQNEYEKINSHINPLASLDLTNKNSSKFKIYFGIKWFQFIFG